jgi:hypothetical protein
MGMRMGFSRSTFDSTPVDVTPTVRIEVVHKHETTRRGSGDPNPKRFELIRRRQCGPNLVVELRYPDCNNYEGRKILVFRNTSWTDLAKQGEIDPHFSNIKKMRSPFARLEPTSHGWRLAVRLAGAMSVIV